MLSLQKCTEDPCWTAWNIKMHTWLLLKCVPQISCHDVKASLTSGKSLRKTSFRQGSGRCNRKGTCCSFIKKSILCSSPTPAQPPHMMLLCWCHIDYADRKLPLLVPRSLPSVIHLRGWAELTLKAIFSMFSAFSGRAADNGSPTGGLGDSSFPSHSSILIAF